MVECCFKAGGQPHIKDQTDRQKCAREPHTDREKVSKRQAREKHTCVKRRNRDFFFGFQTKATRPDTQTSKSTDIYYNTHPQHPPTINLCSPMHWQNGWYNGSTMMLMKPICCSGKLWISRFIRSEIGRPSLRSSSPCSWNSCMSRSVHCKCSSLVFEACERSPTFSGPDVV